MKYRIIEEIDGIGHSVFYAQYEELSFFFKNPKWVYVHDIFVHYKARKQFGDAKQALRHVKRCYAPVTSKIVQEGEL